MNLSKAEILKFLKTDRAILALCILSALIFWLTNKMSETFNSEGEVAMKFEIPAGTVITSPTPKSIKVLYKGSGWNLLRNEQLNEVKVAVESRKATHLSLIHISEPTRPERISYAVFCWKKKTG